MPPNLQIVFVTCPAEAAEDLARTLVEARVAACVNLLPRIVSVYRWQDAVQREEEALLLIKAPAEGFEALRQAVLAHHPYELPEVVAVNPDAVHQPYLDWVLASCR
ncbi:divalent-cation tolerance protein CutA [Solimonas sp. K1W22B-7]|uniref:divalent-cation tolerance protein CutA n=1 Tax=Solimonas sp. K1W22B-7 TaxID=2303331 RepID=UPI000E331F38|nr:divalent-cation tolerance protein CutA [Solimonas sp. K1W22B-7]AXQ29873.1 divalent-cation tolerance protein CutA [Solimonas sp. K1W22B-7]